MAEPGDPDDPAEPAGPGDAGGAGGAEGVIPFPFSRSGVSKHRGTARNLGLTRLSASVKSSGRGAKGHWCNSCKGIWYTYFLEVECPVCGRRG